MAVRGGERILKLCRTGGKGGVKRIRVGFFDTARYEDGTPVTNVAAWNEFGTENTEGGGGRAITPERPFFRLALKDVKDDLRKLVAQEIDTEKMTIDPVLAGRAAELVKSRIQQSIVELRQPPNAPRTIATKKSSNPLIDSGFMRQSVTYKIDT